ncbi:PREDICTED: DNA-directed RNA polymerases I and III subunit RPAC1-like [Rhagoletis zephyria]|uniref:DNA-directed RNA polymerases I and III subunit RPAC1-like n=1 Tax=Rhagoletis zephyria TaxID=28612 RepID=UPI00081131D0|nr:PREDICTED: DNA-directed RNA polymerases I and III subunit RPAC1-like [Rhagoletis zephyria]
MKASGFSIEIHKLSEEELVFDVRGYHVSFANAIRRILLAEIPSMAIENVELYNNTSVMHDEFLGLRLGLIPIKVDAKQFEFQKGQVNTENNTIIFQLNVRNLPTAKENLHVYSRDLEWQPLGDQKETFPDGIAPVDGDILIAKLAPSQKIEATLYCRKGIGKDHAKFSPVAGCFYRHLTTFDLAKDKPLTAEEVEKLKTCFPKGHFKFPGDSTSDYDNERVKSLQIVNNRLESSELTFKSCPSLEEKLLITTSDDTLTFTVESIGMVPAYELVLDAIDTLRSKCSRFQKMVSKKRRS